MNDAVVYLASKLSIPTVRVYSNNLWKRVLVCVITCGRTLQILPPFAVFRSCVMIRRLGANSSYQVGSWFRRPPSSRHLCVNVRMRSGHGINRESCRVIAGIWTISGVAALMLLVSASWGILWAWCLSLYRGYQITVLHILSLSGLLHTMQSYPMEASVPSWVVRDFTDAEFIVAHSAWPLVIERWPKLRE